MDIYELAVCKYRKVNGLYVPSVVWRGIYDKFELRELLPLLRQRFPDYNIHVWRSDYAKRG